MRREVFEELVRRALEELPPEIEACLDNVDVVVETWATRRQLAEMSLHSRYELFGLYQGIPLTERTYSYSMVLPDKVTIFQGPIEAACRTEPEIVQQVRETVIHEIAHHVGIDDQRLEEMGLG